MNNFFSNKSYNIYPLLLPLVFVTISGCGTASPDGMCKTTSASNYVAATQDIDGTPWSITVGLEGGSTNKKISINCPKSAEGTGTIYATVKDGKKNPKAGVLIKGTSDVHGVKIDETSSDTNTDTCGVAKFSYSYKCPDVDNGKSSGYLVINSGALGVSVEMEITTTVTATATAAP